MTEKSLYHMYKEETFRKYEGYEIGVYSGIISGIIVAVAILVFDELRSSISPFLAALIAIIFIWLVYYLFVKRPMKKQRDYWRKFERDHKA